MLEPSEESIEGFSVLRSFKVNSCRIIGRPWPSRKHCAKMLCYNSRSINQYIKQQDSKQNHRLETASCIIYQCIEDLQYFTPANVHPEFKRCSRLDEKYINLFSSPTGSIPQCSLSIRFDSVYTYIPNFNSPQKRLT